MCAAVGLQLATLGLSGAKAVGDFQAQRAAARDQERRQRAQAEQVRRATIAGFDQIQLARAEEEEALAEARARDRRAEVTARERARVRAGETGLSLTELERDIGARAGRENAARDRAARRLMVESRAELEALSRDGSGRLAQQPAIRQSSPIALADRLFTTSAIPAGRL